MENTLRCNCNFDIKGIYGLKKNFAKIRKKMQSILQAR